MLKLLFYFPDSHLIVDRNKLAEPNPFTDKIGALLDDHDDKVMEHYKKRFIHNLEKPPKLTDDPTVASETTTTNGKVEEKSSEADAPSQIDKEAKELDSCSGTVSLKTITPSVQSCSSDSPLADQNGEKADEPESSGVSYRKLARSGSSCSSDSSSGLVEKKRDVITKIARRKSVSRTQFRHNSIQIFQLGPSKYLVLCLVFVIWWFVD